MGLHSVSQERSYIRAMWLLMTPGRPTSPAREEKGVIDIANDDRVAHRLLFEMALQTKRLVTFIK